MSDNKNEAASMEDTIRPANADRPLRNLHVKRVPWSVWAKARHNALLSNVPFRDFIIALLDRSTPLLFDDKDRPRASEIEPESDSLPG
jgi:hypothetical protein